MNFSPVRRPAPTSSRTDRDYCREVSSRSVPIRHLGRTGGARGARLIVLGGRRTRSFCAAVVGHDRPRCVQHVGGGRRRTGARSGRSNGIADGVGGARRGDALGRRAASGNGARRRGRRDRAARYDDPGIRAPAVCRHGERGGGQRRIVAHGRVRTVRRQARRHHVVDHLHRGRASRQRHDRAVADDAQPVGRVCDPLRVRRSGHDLSQRVLAPRHRPVAVRPPVGQHGRRADRHGPRLSAGGRGRVGPVLPVDRGDRPQPVRLLGGTLARLRRPEGRR